MRKRGIKLSKLTYHMMNRCHISFKLLKEQNIFISFKDISEEYAISYDINSQKIFFFKAMFGLI